MSLRDMRHFVCQDAGKFVFISRRFQQTRMYADESARQRKRIDGRIFDDEKVNL